MALRDPERNFEALWLTFRNRYPFFALRGVDWTKQYQTYRPKVTKKTTDDELFQMVEKSHAAAHALALKVHELAGGGLPQSEG